jgi:hypothetical protein
MGFQYVDGWHEVGDGPVCLVGAEQYGLETVMEVEDDCGWNRFWGRGEEVFAAARRTRADRAERGIEICGF